MSKTVRIVLYVLSVIAVIGLIAAFVTADGEAGTSQVMQPDAVTGETDDATEDHLQTEEDGQISAGTEAGNETEVTETERQTEETEHEEDAETSDKKPAGAQTAEDETTIIFTGDVLFANAFKAGYDAGGIDGVIAPELLEELQAADILMVNNEFPFSDRGTPMADKQFTFRCSPSYVSALEEMGADVVSLANNHTLDYGKEALLDTFAVLDGAGIRYGGAGESVERAEEVQVIEVNGRKYGFLAVSRVVPTADWKVENSTPGLFSCYDDTRLVELVKEAKKSCDFLAVYPHWGVEHQSYPENYQTTIAQRCIEAGADVIVGSHTHCLQGVSYIEDKPVFYSLGNFVFGQSIDRSAIVKVTIAGEAVSYELLPVYAADGVTRLAEGEQAAQILSYMDGISDAGIGADGSVTQ